MVLSISLRRSRSLIDQSQSSNVSQNELFFIVLYPKLKAARKKMRGVGNLTRFAMFRGEETGRPKSRDQQARLWSAPIRERAQVWLVNRSLRELPVGVCGACSKAQVGRRFER